MVINYGILNIEKVGITWLQNFTAVLFYDIVTWLLLMLSFFLCDMAAQTLFVWNTDLFVFTANLVDFTLDLVAS